MNNKLKLKDIVLLALLTALFLIFYMIATALVSFAGAFGHAISPGVCGVFTGTIMYFITRKVGKMWQFTVVALLLMGVFALMGGFYLPWLITSVIGSVAADCIASREHNPSVLKVALAAGIMQVGSALGGIIPANFFAEQYINDWVQRGQPLESMLEMVKYSQGLMGILATVVTFVLSIIGVYLGYSILKKHFES